MREDKKMIYLSNINFVYGGKKDKNGKAKQFVTKSRTTKQLILDNDFSLD